MNVAIKADQCKWNNIDMMSDELKITKDLLYHLFGSLTISMPKTCYHTKVDIGLHFKSKETSIPFHIHRKEYGGMQYSDQIKDFIAKYKEKFPLLFQNMEKFHPSEEQKNYPSDKVFPCMDPMQMEEQTKEIMNFIRSNSMSFLPLVPLNTEMLSQKSSKLLEMKLRTLQNSLGKLTVEQVIEVPTKYVFSEKEPVWFAPFKCAYSSEYRLGDRIVIAKTMGQNSMPLGSKGTIIGKNSEYVFVMLDDEYITGRSLEGFSTNFKGKMAPLESIINISMWERKFKSQSKK